MIRRLNYTGRKTIRKADAQVTLAPGTDGSMRFGVQLNLSHYRFPDTACVIVEALRQTSWQRFDFGSVRHLRTQPGELLPEFGAAEGVRFRIKVVQPPESVNDGLPPRLLALADHIQAAQPDTQRAKSLLPVDFGEFKDEVWRLEFDDQGEPILYLSRHLVPDREQLVGSRQFASLVLPQVFRRILEEVLLESKHQDTQDTSDWRSRWLKLACSLPGPGVPPEVEEKEAARQWIGDKVAAFCRQAKIAQRFTGWWNA